MKLKVFSAILSLLDKRENHSSRKKTILGRVLLAQQEQGRGWACPHPWALAQLVERGGRQGAGRPAHSGTGSVVPLPIPLDQGKDEHGQRRRSPRSFMKQRTQGDGVKAAAEGGGIRRIWARGWSSGGLGRRRGAAVIPGAPREDAARNLAEQHAGVGLQPRVELLPRGTRRRSRGGRELLEVY